MRIQQIFLQHLNEDKDKSKDTNSQKSKKQVRESEFYRLLSLKNSSKKLANEEDKKFFNPKMTHVTSSDKEKINHFVNTKKATHLYEDNENPQKTDSIEPTE